MSTAVDPFDFLSDDEAPVTAVVTAAPTPVTAALPQTLRDVMTRLMVAREESKQRGELVAGLRAKFEDTIAVQSKAAIDAAAIVKALEAEARALGVILVDQDNTNRTPAPGVTMKPEDVYTFTDNVAALDWARASRIGYIAESFDPEAVAKAIKSSKQSFEFVKIERTWKASLAKDLAAAFAADRASVAP